MRGREMVTWDVGCGRIGGVPASRVPGSRVRHHGVGSKILLPGCHRGIGSGFGSGEALLLDFAVGFHPLTDGGREFAGLGTCGGLAEADAGDFNVDVDAIWQCSGIHIKKTSLP